MIKNYFNRAFRSLQKNTRYHLINIIGLCIGIAAFIYISTFVYFELSFDMHNENYDRIARITTSIRTPESDDVHLATTPYPLADALKNEFAEVDEAVRIEQMPVGVTFKNELINEGAFYRADQSIFSVFTFRFLEGNPDNALTSPNQIVLTRKIADKYFGHSQDIIGKTLHCNNQDYTVMAIVADLPKNTDLHIEAILSANFSENTSWMEDDFPAFTFVTMKMPIDLALFEQKIQSLSVEHIRPELDASGAKGYRVEFDVEAMRNVHFSEGKQMDTNKGNRRLTYILSGLAFIILLVAMLNYINLTTARATDRAKEVSIRKVNGANSRQIAVQFIVESALVIFIAWLCATAIVQLLISPLNTQLGIELSVSWKTHLVFFVVFFIITVLLSSFYPAAILSNYKPLHALSGPIQQQNRRFSLRKIIIVTQLTVTTTLIICTMGIYLQVYFLNNTDKGFHIDQTVSIDLPRDNGIHKQIHAFVESVRQVSSVTALTVGNGILAEDVAKATTFAKNKGQERHLFSNYLFIDYDFLSFFKINLHTGRNLSQEVITDADAGFLVNEAFVRTMGWSQPIGQEISGFGRTGKVIGVVDNFYNSSMHNLVEPLVMIYRTEKPWYLSLKIAPDNLYQIKNLWNKHFPNHTFEYRFLDEFYAQHYSKDNITMKVFVAFAMLSILISCLGLYSLATVMASTRLKEIGIRKVLGASVSSVIRLLGRSFITLVFIAIFIACPIAWYLMQQWLSDFAYKIDLSIWIFVLGSVTTTFVVILTVSYQTIRAARANPVESLRDE